MKLALQLQKWLMTLCVSWIHLQLKLAVTIKQYRSHKLDMRIWWWTIWALWSSPPKKVPVKSLGSLGSGLLPSPGPKSTRVSTSKLDFHSAARGGCSGTPPPRRQRATLCPLLLGRPRTSYRWRGQQKGGPTHAAADRQVGTHLYGSRKCQVLIWQCGVLDGSTGDTWSWKKGLVESQWFCMVSFFLFNYDYVYAVYAYVTSFGGQFFGWGTEDLTL